MSVSTESTYVFTVLMNRTGMEFFKLRIWRRSHQWSDEFRNESTTA